jgi:hypothetical protein
LTKAKYHSSVKKIYRSLIDSARITRDFQNYSRYNTSDLINYMETGVSNFFFKECKAPMANGLMRFLVTSRAGIQFTSKKEI